MSRFMPTSKNARALLALWGLLAAGAVVTVVMHGVAFLQYFIPVTVLLGFITAVMVLWRLMIGNEGITLHWVDRHFDDLKHGRLVIDGTKISHRDSVHSYTWTFSLILVSIRRQTDYYHPEMHDLNRIRRVADAFTWVLGWWMIPFGIMWSIQGLRINRQGGIQRTIHDLMREVHERRKDGLAGTARRFLGA